MEKLLIQIDPGLKRQLRQEAQRRGTTMSKLTRNVLREYLDEIEAKDEFGRWIERARGSATSSLTTDEIMALTRGE